MVYLQEMQQRGFVSLKTAFFTLQKFSAVLALEKTFFLAHGALAQGTARVVECVAESFAPEHLLSEKLLQGSPFSHRIILEGSTLEEKQNTNAVVLTELV
jgi:hypothetical protein